MTGAQSPGRGQTTLDFLVGTSIFLLAVAVSVGAVTGTLAPLGLQDAAEPTNANRAATTLATDVLSGPATPYRLEADRVDAVFADPPAAHLDLPPESAINVTLTNASGRVAATGPPLPDRGSIATAWRTVEYRGETATLRVRVW
ncbi:MAG: hypothetical protein ABEJ77_05930 [Halanaeroarchaeum sp.]